MYRRRRRALVKRYRQPKDTGYFRYTVDILVGLAKKANSVDYEWAGSGSPILGINSKLNINDNFKQFCKQFSYVRIKSIAYLCTPDARNQANTQSGFVGLSVWPRGFETSFGTWEKAADNPFFKILNVTSNTYKYCNILGGDNEWRSTSEGEFTLASLSVVSSFSLAASTAEAPQWLVKVSVQCVFKSPVQ